MSLINASALSAQSFKKIPVGKSGCTVYTYCDLKFDISRSQDSSVVYAGECEKELLNYGVICVKLSIPREKLDEAENLLIAYMDYLKVSFGIKKAAGYGKGHLLNNNTGTRGVLDYWEDAEQHWKIKGWTNGRFIGVMYVYGKNALPESKVNVFLDGLRFE